MTNELTLTKALVGVTKWSGKLAFTFFIISAILVAITINNAEPSVNYYSIDADTTIITQYIHMDEPDNAQIAFSVDNENTDYHSSAIIYKITVKLIRESDGKEIWSVTSSEYFKNIYLPTGSYRIEVTANQYLQFVMGSGNFNAGLVGITSVFLAIFGILMSILWTVLPFTILALIIQSVSKTEKIQPQTAEQKRKLKPKKVYAKRTPNIIQADSWFSKLLRKDWILVGLAVFSLFLAIIEPSSPGLFFAFLFSLIVFYNVTERERTKHRLLVLLNNYPKTTLEFLSLQLDKKSKDIVKTLQIMILDDGLPIQLNLIEKTIQVVGDLPVQTQVHVPTIPLSKPGTHFSDQSTLEIKRESSEPEIHCTNCGEQLVSKVKYCYSCGQRQ